jgi:hypothetical protein
MEPTVTTKTITIRLDPNLWAHIKAGLALRRIPITEATIAGLCSMGGVDRKAFEPVSESTEN